MAEPSFENSASWLEGIAHGVREVGWWEKLERAAPPQQFVALKHPHEKRWWPGHVLLELMGLIDEPNTVQRISYLAVKKAIAPIAMPLVKVTFVFAEPTPHTILSRAGMFGATTLRGVKLDWHRKGETSGELVNTYPVPPHESAAALWRGVIEYVFELTQVEGTVGVAWHDGPRLGLPVSWLGRSRAE